MYAWWVLGKGGRSASALRQCYERSRVMNESFNGKVALVTGAGAGMGLATAKAFAEAGASGAGAGIPGGAGRGPGLPTPFARWEKLWLSGRVWEPRLGGCLDQ